MATAENTEWDESEVENEIENWCLSLKPVEMDGVLGELELAQVGTRSARADRLFRRLRGDYTAADFARSEMSLEDEDESIRRIQAKVVIENTNLSINAKNYIYERQQQRVGRSAESESILALPLANSTNDSNSPTLSENARITTSEVVVTTDMVTYAGPSISYGISTTYSSVQTTVAHNTMTDTTISTTSLQGGIISTRETTNSDTILCKLADGNLYEVRREVAIEIARLQAAIRNVEEIANTPTMNTPEYDRLQRALQSENAASSTRIAAPQTQRNTGAIPRRNVMFQDTFDLRYFRNENIPPGGAHGNKQENDKRTQLGWNANTQEFQPRIPTPAAPRRGESGGGGDSRVSQIYDTASSQRPPDLSALSLANKQWDIGRIVRTWKIKFDGEKGSSIEEFIQRVDECRTLARIPDDDLLNAMTELMSGVALYWCRQSRVNWHTWADFCVAARRCYGLDSKFQQRLVVEAQTRTQGRNEPVRDYIVCLLTMLSKMEKPWSVEEQLDLLHKNMLPNLKQLVKRHKFMNVDKLLELARDAEDLIIAERNYKPPPKPEESLLPELAYKEPGEVKSEKPTKTARPSVSAIAETSPGDLTNLIEQLLDKKLKQHANTLASSKQKTPNTEKTGKKDSAPPRPGSPKQGEKGSGKKKRSERPPRTPDSEKNKDKEAGPLSFAVCWGCSWPGYIRSGSIYVYTMQRFEEVGWQVWYVASRC